MSLIQRIRFNTIIGVTSLFFLAIVCVQAQTVQDTSPSPVRIKDGWQFRWGDSPFDEAKVPLWTYQELDSPEWKPTPSLANLPGHKGRKIVWLRILLPERAWDAPTIFLPRVKLHFEAYLESTRIYAFGDLKPAYVNRFSAFVPHRIILPDDFQGKTLFFRIFTDMPELNGIDGPVLLGSKETLNLQIINESISYFIIGAFCVFIGLFSLIIFLERSVRKTYAVFAFGLFATSSGIAFIAAQPIAQVLLHSPVPWYYLLFVSFLIFPAALVAFVDQVIGRGYKSFVRRLWQIHVAIAVVALVLEVLEVMPLPRWNPYLQYLWFVDVFVIIFASVYGAIKGSFEARIFTAGVVFFSLSGLHDLINRRGDLSLMPWGTFIFILLLGYLLFHRFIENNKRLQVYSKELEEKSEKLESAKEKLEEYSQTLEQKVEDRTLALSEKNKQLEQTLDDLKKAQEQLIIREKMASLGNLVAGIAHEINNPVGAMHSATDVSRRSVEKMINIIEDSATVDEVKSNKKYQQALKILENNLKTASMASDRVATIVQSLRTFARLDEADFQEADIHECLDSTLTLIDHKLKNRVSVEKDYGKVPIINCYVSELNQVFMNVLINASQSIEEKGTIQIKTKADKKKVYIEISDTGVGISSEQLPKLFDPGFTTKGVGVGVGLGLSICYNIIQKHKGEISVKSEKGKGSTFKITLPINPE